MTGHHLSVFSSLVVAGTAIIADIFDQLGEEPLAASPDFQSLRSQSTEPFAGPAFTIDGYREAWSGQADLLKLQSIDAMEPGVVAVWAGNDIRGTCCFGDLLAEAMHRRGCAGVVVDGGVRDVAALADIDDMPIVARYRTPIQAIGRWRVRSFQTVVSVRGAIKDWIEVHPGDIVVSDGDGVLFVPRRLLPAVQQELVDVRVSESGAREDITDGMGLMEAIKKYGHL